VTSTRDTELRSDIVWPLTPKVIDRHFKNEEASETYPPCDIMFVYKLHGRFKN